MKWKPSTPSSAEAGLSLIELLVAAAIALVILMLAFGLVVSNRRVYNQDRARTAVNQNLRAALDLIGADVRQAGERLPKSFPAVEVVDGWDRDELILRKNLLDAVLPVCMDVVGNANAIFVNRPGNAPHPNPACYRVDGNGNGWDDRMEAWRAYRCRQDGVDGCQGNSQEVVRAYIYDPANGKSEWFTYTGEDMSLFKIHKAAQPPWANSYPASDQPVLYLLKERRYRLNGDVLEVIVNGDAAHPLKLVDRMQKFAIKVALQNGTTKTSFGPGDDWTQIKAVEVALEGMETFRGHQVKRALSGRYLPRNVLSY